MGAVKNRKSKFSELGLPGGEIVEGPCRSILHTTRPCQLPYGAKSDFFVEFMIFQYFPYCPFKGTPYCAKYWGASVCILVLVCMVLALVLV